MAAANSDQENVLLQSDEGSPSAPLPAGRLPFKAALAVGLCVFAAGLAGAVMMGRPAARAPTNIWHHRWSAIGLNEHESKHLTKECVDLLEAERKAQEGSRRRRTDPFSEWKQDCKEESEQACTVDYLECWEGYDCYNITYEECYPAVCKEANIFKEVEAYHAPSPATSSSSRPAMQISGLTVSCAAPGDEFKYMTKECADLLEALEKEAEEEGRTHERGGGGKYRDAGIEGTLDCKEGSEQACSIYYSMWDEDITQEKCFPAVCKEANIFKQLEANLAEDTSPSFHLHGLAVSCSGGTTTTTTNTTAKSRAGQCGPDVGLLGASVLVASIFAQ